MREDIILYIKDEIKQKCKSSDNFFGEGIYYHIEAVVKNAQFLAEKYEGDVEIVTIAAWLHDIASITDYKYYKDHHIHGAEIAKKILLDFKYDDKKIILVQNCILNHRGSVIKQKNSIEELIISDADAISHLDTVPQLLYLAYVKRNLSINEGIDFVKNKLERSYNKLSLESKKLYEGKYREVIKLLQ